MQLVLGTVQFGLAYGIAGSGSRIDDASTRSILEHAWQAGIRLLDTAPAYGDIEGRLDRLCADLDFRVVSKVSAPPDAALDAPALLASLQRSRERLGARLVGVLFHHATDLGGDAGDALWARARDWAREHGVMLGSSGYGPDELRALQARLGLDFVQLPGNALDQRVRERPVGTTEVHLRSCFLQGLLLMPIEQAERRLPLAAPALRRWHGWLKTHDLSPVVGALSVVRGFPGVTHCVIGVDSAAQLDAIVQAWHNSRVLSAEELQSSDMDIIDPRRWRLS